MTGFDTQESIKAKLQAFLQELKSPDSTSPTLDDSPLPVLSGRFNVNFGLYDPRTKEIEAIQAILPRYKIVEFEDCQVLRGGHVHHRVLFHVTIHNSNLENCTLIQCIIYQSNVNSSQLEDCRIQKEAGGGNDMTSAPCLKNCKITKGTIFDAYIYNSTLNKTGTIHNCHTEGSLVVDSNAIDSTFTNCGFHESELGNCEVVSPDPTPPDVVINFRGFPAEIRKMVCLNAIASEEISKNLVAALRPDPVLHSEVLEVLFREQAFVLSEKNHEAVASSPKSITKRVMKLKLNMDGKGVPTKDVSAYFPADTKIIEVGIKFEGNRPNIDHFYNVTKTWLKYFGTVRKFEVFWTNTGPGSVHANPINSNPPAALLGCIRVANKWLKTEGVLVKGKIQVKKPGLPKASEVGLFTVLAHGEEVVEVLEVDTFTWSWTASKNNVLIWNS